MALDRVAWTSPLAVQSVHFGDLKLSLFSFFVGRVGAGPKILYRVSSAVDGGLFQKSGKEAKTRGEMDNFRVKTFLLLHGSGAQPPYRSWLPQRISDKRLQI